jgi:hypothetical protein
MTPDQHEQDCAEALLGYAYNLAATYNHNPGDMDASIIALLVRAIELYSEKEINMIGMYQ